MCKNKKIKHIPFEYKNVRICGGGFVTGILFHPTDENTAYIRTDIGGIYRYEPATESFTPLCTRATDKDNAETFPLAFALDKNNSNRLFFVGGSHSESFLFTSDDKGENICRKPLPCYVHGNCMGRATGGRLIFRNDTLYFGSCSEGILISNDMGDSWEKTSVNGETNITLLTEINGIFIAGVSGEKNSNDMKHRGHTLYYSSDSCKSFQKLYAPKSEEYTNCSYYGFVPQRTAYDGKYLYITFSSSGIVFYGGMDAYSCDNGNLGDGRIYRYRFENNQPVFDADITPTDSMAKNGRKILGGYSGIDCKGGMIVASTVCRKNCDIIYRSFDYGEHWEIILCGLEKGEISWNVPYMKPEYSGGRSCIHWISDVKISPHNANFMLFNTGTGLFSSHNLTDKNVHFETFSEGIEETVHMNVYSMPKGRVRILDLVGDLGGFAFENYDKTCENTFADENNNRYVTCLNADFPLDNPKRVVVAARGNWTGQTKGGIILSEDECVTWKHLSYPYGFSEKTDKVLDNIQRPNVNSGRTAISCDGKRILWAVEKEFGMISSDMTFYTDNDGQNWQKSEFTDYSGKALSETRIKLFSDSCDSNFFVAYSGDMRFFASTDKGEHFYEALVDAPIPFMPSTKSTFVKVPNMPHTFLLANGTGLYIISFDNELNVAWRNILSDKNLAISAGVGKGLTDDCPSIYMAGFIDGEYGYFMSDDMGENWAKINNDNQCFGTVNAICGDMREHGLFYIATGTMGLIYGRIN